MITLTIAPQINAVLGGNNTVAYDKFVLSSIVYNTVDMIVSGRILITSTTEPTMQALVGSLVIDTNTALLTIEVPQLDFYRQINLTIPQNDVVRGYITGAQDQLENGLISVAVVQGVQTTGV